MLGGRLCWYGDPPDDEFWGELWTSRLTSDYFTDADRGDLQDLEVILTRHMRPDGRNIEAGCGLGYWVAALQARGFAVEGVDYSESLVEAVNRARPDLTIRQGDAMALTDYPDASVDAYLSFGVVEHWESGPEPFLIEAARIIRPNGAIIISVPFFSPMRRMKARLNCFDTGAQVLNRPFFQYGFSEAEFGELLKRSGFRLIDVHYQFVQRSLVEEVPLYFWLNRRRGARVLRRLLLALVPPSLAGHMVLFVGKRISSAEDAPSDGRNDAAR